MNICKYIIPFIRHAKNSKCSAHWAILALGLRLAVVLMRTEIVQGKVNVTVLSERSHGFI